MKILKEGNPAKAVISCHHCKCEMEYTNKDMHEVYQFNSYNAVSDNLSKVGPSYYIECPCCGERIFVNKL